MKKIITYLLILIGGIFLGFLLNGSSDHTNKDQGNVHEGHNHSTKETVWTCAMHPQIRQSEFGLCPICGMDLTPLEDESDMASNPLEVRMSPTAMQLANVVTGTVKEASTMHMVNLNGKIEVDERKVTTLTTHIGGRLEKLLVSYTGEFIKKGQIVAYVYSPELVIAQNELLEAYKYRTEQPEIYQASREKIKNWKVTQTQIDHIIETNKVIHNFPILSHLSGVVTSKLVNMGDHVMTGGPLFEIANLSTVWAMFDIYERDLSLVNIGDEIEFHSTTSAQNITGKISFIDPILNETTRVSKARVVLNNTGQYKPGMFLKGVVKHHNSENTLQTIVPKSAVLWTGKRSIVYVKTNSDNGFGFVLREVELGTLLSDEYSILSGLKPGEEIAIHGAFSIDAAAQLAGKPSMMNVHAGLSHEQINALEVKQSFEGFKKQDKWMESWNAVLEQYFELKDFLTEDNLKGAQENGIQLAKLLSEFDSSELTPEQIQLWQDVQVPLNKSINQFNTYSDILKARHVFKTISDKVIYVATHLNDKNKTLFIHTCPMAVNNKEGEWLSKEKAVINPFMGASMLRCGTMKEQLN